ncbi:MAG: hypothetical protein OXH69_17500 [Acidobacteria bacterium]|nr:hypothetical protein [Acidobacteriota bacterium]
MVERRNRQGETYELYHLSDANVADLGSRVSPGAAEVDGRPTARAERWMEENGVDKPDADAIHMQMISNRLESRYNLERRTQSLHGRVVLPPSASGARGRVPVSQICESVPTR